jgi:Protein of unknown function, DUF547
MKKHIFQIAITVIAISVVSPQAPAAFDHSHTGWNELLGRHVNWVKQGTASVVDYAGFMQDRHALDSYLASLSAVGEGEFRQWPRDRRLAFLINAYNAFTVSLILTRYPELNSIKDLGSLFKSPWKKRFFTLLGKKRHLDEIEHGMIREPGRYDDPRIHAAVNCAAIGCPALRPEAYRGDALDAQLEDNLRRFLSDKSRNRFNAQTRTIEAGKIFDWYESDFTKGDRGFTSLKQFFSRYAHVLAQNPDHRAIIRDQRAKIDFVPYDWKLNTDPGR